MMHKRKIWLDSCSTKSALPRAPTYRSSTTSWKAINTIFYCNLPPEDHIVILKKNGNTVDNTKEKLLNSWVYHIRTLVISPGSVAVTY